MSYYSEVIVRAQECACTITCGCQLLLLTLGCWINSNSGRTDHFPAVSSISLQTMKGDTYIDNTGSTLRQKSMSHLQPIHFYSPCDTLYTFIIGGVGGPHSNIRQLVGCAALFVNPPTPFISLVMFQGS